MTAVKDNRAIAAAADGVLGANQPSEGNGGGLAVASEIAAEIGEMLVQPEGAPKLAIASMAADF